MKPLRTALPVVLIVLAPMAMLYPLWRHPTSAGEDDVIYYYPLRKMVGESLREGRWPLENWYEATGMPLMADPQSAVMYPPTWLFAALPAKLAYSLTLFLAFSLAGGGAWLYLRRLGLMRPAACFGATAFMFCGFLVGHRVHWSILHAGAYLPWGLWCIELLRRRPLAAFGWMVPTAFLMIAAGHWPTGIHVGLIWVAYLLLRGRPLGRSLLIAAAAMVLAAAVMAPQIDATRHLLTAATRNRIGYATAGENSFFPASGVLALFPFLFGSRTPNLFSQSWWGPWHLCETLGYVGLATLVLAGSAVWALVRRRKKGEASSDGEVPRDAGPSASATDVSALRPLVRAWTWIGIGAGLFMLGYYLPTYRLIHLLPVLGVVRCPARMLLAADMALATLAAVAVHLLATKAAPGGPAERVARLRGCVLRGATRVLPVAMLATLLVVAAAGALAVAFLGGELPFFQGGAGWQALKAVVPPKLSVWMPLLLAAATIATLLFWLKAPRRRAGALVGLLLVDLFFVTRFVDVPGAGRVAPDPEVSPAAEWLRKHGAPNGSCRVLGIGDSYHDRAAELLRPKTAHALGFATINAYGPFQAPAHAHLLSFRIFGTNRDWAWLIRRNRLLSAYHVRYVLTARRDVRDVLESVRVPAGPAPPDGPNLLKADWRLDLADIRDGVLHLRTPVLWWLSKAEQPVRLKAGAIYRIALDARAPDGGAANFLRAEIHNDEWRLAWDRKDPLGLMAHEEQIGEEWRHFEWTLQMPDDLAGEALFRVFTMSERPVEVRNVSLRESRWPGPADATDLPEPGEPVYRLVAELAAVDPADPPVAIYENLANLAVAREDGTLVGARDMPVATSAEIERLKWPRAQEDLYQDPPRVGIVSAGNPRRMLWLLSVPAGGLYVILLWVLRAARRRRRA